MLKDGDEGGTETHALLDRWQAHILHAHINPAPLHAESGADGDGLDLRLRLMV